MRSYDPFYDCFIFIAFTIRKLALVRRAFAVCETFEEVGDTIEKVFDYVSYIKKL